ncbi:dihydrolipoyl dehydrogenase family protein [Ktedonospora formicarum]|uniref:Mercuric reductase n=1 Tax=Ktedonospora formicarum TaxID=2778364 RepID=A0A8J3HZK2_9CHLR|nr:NAD(P)/FAD-dependent oxidoreductase [Ktedonospora formicarum]GHO44881.1 mercuric reductase [Ktedonospora formicarum]
MTLTRYDVMVIGAGAAGISAAREAAAQGMRVALAERSKLGGTYLNYGCDPTKALLHIARLRHQALHAAPYGLRIPEVAIDWPGIQRYVHETIDKIQGGAPAQAREQLRQCGIELLEGEAEFVSEHEVGIGGQLHDAARIIVTAGSHTIMPTVEGLDHIGFLTNVEAVSLSRLPRSLAIIGGGPIGVEFAQMFQRFDVQVTLLDQAPTLLTNEDREPALILHEILTQEGIRIKTGVILERAERALLGKRIHFRDASGHAQQLEVEEILLATGREPNLEPLHLEAANVQTAKGRILVDATLRTSAPYIWAAGDVVGTHFTPTASAQGMRAARNALAHQPQPFNIDIVPWAVFTDPPLAHVGKTEEQLRANGIPYRVARTWFKDNTRAILNGHTKGLIKLLIDEQNQILGAHILGERADDLITPIVLAMHNRLSIEHLTSTTIQYPTLSVSVCAAGIHTTLGQG